MAVLLHRFYRTTYQAISHGHHSARTNLSRPYTSNDGIEQIHMTTHFALARVKCGFRLHNAHVLVYAFSLFHYRKISSNQRMHSNRFSNPTLSICFLDIRFISVHCQFILRWLVFLPPSTLSVLLLFLSFKKIQSKTAVLHRSNLLTITTAHQFDQVQKENG